MGLNLTLFLTVLQLAHFLSVPCQERIWPFHKVHVCKAIRNTGVLHDWVNLNLWRLEAPGCFDGWGQFAVHLLLGVSLHA